MAHATKAPPLPPTVMKVIDKFAAAARADAQISNEAVERIEALLKKGSVANVHEIAAALFDTPSEGEQ